jgi:hypothetical protein
MKVLLTMKTWLWEFIYCKQVVSLVILELWHRVFVDKRYGL